MMLSSACACSACAKRHSVNKLIQHLYRQFTLTPQKVMNALWGDRELIHLFDNYFVQKENASKGNLIVISVWRAEFTFTDNMYCPELHNELETTIHFSGTQAWIRENKDRLKLQLKYGGTGGTGAIMQRAYHEEVLRQLFESETIPF